MTEQQYPIHLRKIGEPAIAEFLEAVMIELDTHEKMFLELCEVKRERDELRDRVAHSEPVRHGRWVQSKVIPSLHSCSHCHAVHKMVDTCNTYALLNYCPHCGAKMDSEVKADDR